MTDTVFHNLKHSHTVIIYVIAAAYNQQAVCLLSLLNKFNVNFTYISYSQLRIWVFPDSLLK